MYICDHCDHFGRSLAKAQISASRWCLFLGEHCKFHEINGKVSADPVLCIHSFEMLRKSVKIQHCFERTDHHGLVVSKDLVFWAHVCRRRWSHWTSKCSRWLFQTEYIYIYIETDHYWFHPFLPSGMITISTYCEHHKEAIAHVLGADCDMVCRRDAEEGGTGALAYILTLGILANFSSRTSAEFDEFWVRCFTPGILDLPIFGKQSSEYALALIMSWAKIVFSIFFL